MNPEHLEKKSSRLTEIREHLSLDVKSLAQVIGMTQQHLYSIERGEKKISLNLAHLLFQKFSVSANWLLFGVGPMQLAQTFTQAEDPHAEYRHSYTPAVQVIDQNENSQVPVLDVRAAADYPRHYQDASYLSHLPALSLPFPDLRNRAYLAIQVDGNSMEETIQHLDYVVCYQVLDLGDLVRGHIYTIITAEGVICKRLGQVQGDRLHLFSDHPAYGAKQVQASSALQVWCVRYKISSNLRRIEPLPAVSDLLGQVDSQLREVNEFLDRFFQNRNT